MLKTALITAVAGLAFGSLSFAQQCGVQDECPVAKKVNGLVAQWEEVAKKAETATPEQRQQFAAQVSSVAEKCPVGSRMGETMAAVEDVLGMLAANQAASASQECPLEAAENPTEAMIAGKQLKEARFGTVNNLYKLVGYTSAMTSVTCESSCSAAAKAGCEASAKASCEASKAETVASSEECSASKAATVASSEQCQSKAATVASAEGCQASQVCPIQLASRIGALKASFASAQTEANAMSTAQRGEILAGFASLGESCNSIELVPQSVMALAEGFDALTQIHEKMGEWAQQNAAMMQDVPESARMGFMMETSLVNETRELLAAVTSTMKIMQTTTETAMVR